MYIFLKWEVLRETFVKEEDLCLTRGRMVQKEGLSLEQR